jgi:hypothetical protein
MKLYQPIRDWSDLPPGPPSRAQETFALDFKAEHQRQPAEQAKDIAAFANAFGGVILVGVPEKSDSYTRKLVSEAAAREIALDYENAARDLLAPRPIIDPCIVRCPQDDGRALVAVNVDPFPGQLIGARCTGSDSWSFPLRTAARHTAYLDPEKMMLYSDARTRKASILLASITEADRKAVWVRLSYRREIGGGFSTTEDLFQGELQNVDIEGNSVTLSVRIPDVHDGKDATVGIWAPLEDVDAVWRVHGKWYIRLNGAVRAFQMGSKGMAVVYMAGRGVYSGLAG